MAGTPQHAMGSSSTHDPIVSLGWPGRGTVTSCCAAYSLMFTEALPSARIAYSNLRRAAFDCAWLV